MVLSIHLIKNDLDTSNNETHFSLRLLAVCFLSNRLAGGGGRGCNTREEELGRDSCERGKNFSNNSLSFFLVSPQVHPVYTAIFASDLRVLLAPRAL